MNVQCETCGLTYDDLYRRTYCEHEVFAMHTVVTLTNGRSQVCTSVEELEAFLGQEHGGE